MGAPEGESEQTRGSMLDSIKWEGVGSWKLGRDQGRQDLTSVCCENQPGSWPRMEWTGRLWKQAIREGTTDMDQGGGKEGLNEGGVTQELLQKVKQDVVRG